MKNQFYIYILISLTTFTSSFLFAPKSNCRDSTNLWHNKAKSSITRNQVTGMMLSIFLAFSPPVEPSVAVSSLGRLEQSIQALESSKDRTETIQGLADVFEAAESKTLLVRTKYKYVMCNYFLDSIFILICSV